MASSKRKRKDEDENDESDEKESPPPKRYAGAAAYPSAYANGLEGSGDAQGAGPSTPHSLQPSLHPVNLQHPASISGTPMVSQVSPPSSTSMVPLQQQNGTHANMNVESPSVSGYFAPSGAAAAAAIAPDQSSADSFQPSCSSSFSGEAQNSGVSSTSCEPSTSKRKSKSTHRRDAGYWEKRRKNNESAKRSRENRRHKEQQVNLKSEFVKFQYRYLRSTVGAMLHNILTLERVVRGREGFSTYEELLGNAAQLNEQLRHDLEVLLMELFEKMKEEDQDLLYLPYGHHRNAFLGPPPPPPPGAGTVA